MAQLSRYIGPLHDMDNEGSRLCDTLQKRTHVHVLLSRRAAAPTSSSRATACTTAGSQGCPWAREQVRSSF